jgi:hypothetical protein
MTVSDLKLKIFRQIDSLEKSRLASNFIDLTENTLSQISINPKQFPICYNKKKVRKCVLTKHNSLFYRDSRSNIQILRIYDTRQDPDTLTFK